MPLYRIAGVLVDVDENYRTRIKEVLVQVQT